MSTTEVFQRWRPLRCDDELADRRLRWYQKISAAPQRHSQLLAAVFGTARLDRHMDKQRLSLDIKVTEDCTPWARQYWADLMRLRDLEGAEWVAELPNALAVFQPGSHREAFLEFDMRQYRASLLWVRVPPPGLGAPSACSTPADIEEERDRPFWCEHKEAGQACSAAFATRAQLSVHVRTAHRCRDLIATLIVGNECPFCYSTFA